MIQRVQSLYWLLSVVLLLIFYVSDFAFIKPVDASITLSAFYGIVSIPAGAYAVNLHTWPLHVAVLLPAFLTFVTIFFFKRRVLQIRLSILTIMLELGLLGLAYFYYRMLAGGIEGLASLSILYTLPIISVILKVLAIFGVKRDIAILRSLTRL